MLRSRRSWSVHRPTAVVAALISVLVLLAGCVSYTPSVVPESMLDAEAGNGWVLDRKEPPSEPSSKSFGLVKSQTFIYKDPGESGNEDGYPASLSVVSLKVAFQQPDRDEITDRARTLVEDEADRLGVELEKPPEEGERETASGDTAAYFLYDGTAEQESDVFDREADVKVVGIVWNCADDGGNTVVGVGLAQVNERTQGVIEEPDDRNWVELWEDADRSTSEQDGGLMIHASCGG